MAFSLQVAINNGKSGEHPLTREVHIDEFVTWPEANKPGCSDGNEKRTLIVVAV